MLTVRPATLQVSLAGYTGRGGCEYNEHMCAQCCLLRCGRTMAMPRHVHRWALHGALSPLPMP